ncbi:hypothetical protein MnTg02_02881 [bacterium MnTg02]|nr:hypothetical protein MnTg02_02881 [bacterium MnTg02]
MSKNFHESFAQAAVDPPSERSTGFVFTAVAVIVAIIFRSDTIILIIAASLATILLAASLLKPAILKPLNIIWFKFGLLLHRIVNPIVMLAMFAVAIVPAGLLMRIWRDPLRSEPEKEGSTYWIRRDRSELQTGSMKNQF